MCAVDVGYGRWRLVENVLRLVPCIPSQRSSPPLLFVSFFLFSIGLHTNIYRPNVFIGSIPFPSTAGHAWSAIYSLHIYNSDPASSPSPPPYFFLKLFSPILSCSPTLLLFSCMCLYMYAFLIPIPLLLHLSPFNFFLPPVVLLFPLLWVFRHYANWTTPILVFYLHIHFYMGRRKGLFTPRARSYRRKERTNNSYIDTYIHSTHTQHTQTAYKYRYIYMYSYTYIRISDAPFSSTALIFITGRVQLRLLCC